MKKSIPYILFYWLIFSLMVPNMVLSVTEHLTLCGRITNTLLPLGIVGFLSSISRSVGKTALIMLPLTFLSAFQIVLLSLYGNGIISVDMFLNLVTTNSAEACELLVEMWPSLILEAFLYLAPIALGCYCIHSHLYLTEQFRKLNKRIFLWATLAGTVFLASCYCGNDGYDVRRDLYPVNVCYNIHLAFDRCAQTRHYTETSAGFQYEAVSVHKHISKEKYIIVIGETSRAHDWETLGYGRHTNPRLSKRSDLIFADKAYSESNTTHKSVPMLLSCIDARTFDKELYKVKSMISAFKECGFHTSFISNQLPNHSYIDFFGDEADTTLFVKKESPNLDDMTDDDLLSYVERCLGSQHKRQLIVLHTYGSHFNYRERYTERDRVFLPDDYSNASAECREELVNAYDNSIVATDRFLNSLIEMLDNCNCVSGLLYTSDHGEDIFDDKGSRFLHASPTPTVYQLHVPLMVWLSQEYNSRYSEVGETLRRNSNKYVSTSRSFCTTSLSVGGIETKKVDHTDDLTSPSFQSKELYYLDDHNMAVPISLSLTGN